MFIAASGRKTGRLPEPLFSVQIGDTIHCSESSVNHGFQRFALSFNRTAVNSNPCRQVRRNQENPRVREVLDAEIQAFLPHCHDWMRRYIKLKLLTGLRQGDMLALRLDQLREDGLFVETGKRGKKLLFQWTPDLVEAIEAIKALRRRVTSFYLFNNRNGTHMTSSGFQSAWQRAMDQAIAAGSLTERFTESDLRAKVASEAAGLGQDATKMLAHSSDAVTKRHYIRGTQKVQPLNKKY